MSSTKPWDLYAEQLMLNGFGHPLWLPEPHVGVDTSREVLLGDVGFINKGEFVPLFNSQKPEGDPINAERGVPADFNMFAPNRSWNRGPREIILQRVVFSGNIVTENIEGKVEAAVGDKASMKIGWSFETKSKAGAILVLEPPGVAEELWSKVAIVDYMRKNLKSWLRFSNDKQEGWSLGLKEEEIMFVSGTLKTTQWALAAFQGDTFQGKQGHVSAQIGSLASAGISCSIADSSLPSAFYRHGPRNNHSPSPNVTTTATRPDTTHTIVDREKPEAIASATADTTAREKPNQCLFIHYYKMKRRKFWRNQIVANAGPHQLPPGDKRNEGNPEMGPWSISNEDEHDAYDPVSNLLDYILENSKAKIAVASTWDLVDIFPPDMKFPDDIREAIAMAAPQVTVDRDGVGTVVIKNYLEERFTNMQSQRTSSRVSQGGLLRHRTVSQGHRSNDVIPPAPLHPSVVYSSQLFPQGFGYAIWEPEPDSIFKEINIGDVGWLNKGSFLLLFNSRLQKAEDQLRLDTPKNFVPFNPQNLIIRGPMTSSAKSPICADTMQISNIESTSFSFTSNSNAGAFLMFSPTAMETEIMSRRHTITYIKQHFDDWMDYANDKYGLEVKAEDLIFVCGTMKTSRWALAAFHGDYQDQSGTVSADLSPEAMPPRLEVNMSSREIPPTHQKAGPCKGLVGPDGVKGKGKGSNTPTEERNDQCVFIHYYQIKRRLWFMNAIRAAAGPNELPSFGPDKSDTAAIAVGEGTDSDGDEPAMPTTTWNPVNDLLDYILNNSDASTAIGSDLDIYILFKDHEFPSDISAALEELKPLVVVDEDGVGTVVVDSQPEDNKLGQSAESTLYSTEESTHHAGDEKNVAHDGSITALAYSPNGKYAASGSEDTTAIIWDIHSEHMMHRLVPHHDTILALAFARDSDVLASSDERGIILWDVASGTETRRLETHTAVHSLVFSPDGSQLVAGTRDGSIFVWDTATYVDPVTLSKHMAVVTFAVFSADGRYMATGGTESECFVWDMGTLQPKSVLRGHKGMVCAAAFAPDGERIVTASDDCTSRLWDTQTGKTQSILMEHSGAVWTVAFSADGKRVATGSSDSTVKVWNASSGKQQQTLVGHSSMVNVVAYSADGKYLASAAADHTVRLWKAEDGSAVATYNEHGDNVTAVAFSPDSTTIASGAHDGSVHVRTIG